MHAATLRSGARFASTSAQAVAKSSSSAEVVAARLRKAQGQRVEPLIGLYHDSSRFPGHSKCVFPHFASIMRQGADNILA